MKAFKQTHSYYRERIDLHEDTSMEKPSVVDENVAEHNEDEKMEEKRVKMVKYKLWEKEKISLIYKWRLLKTERKLFIIQLLLVEQKLEEMDEKDFDTVELEYYKMECEGDEYRRLLRGNLEKQCQIQEKCEELEKRINSLSIGDSDEESVTLQKKISRAQIIESEVRDQEKSPRTLKGQIYQEKYENIKNEGFKKKVKMKMFPNTNTSEWHHVPLIKKHRRYKKKIKKIRNKKTPSELCQYISELQKFTTFPFMKGKEINSAATTKEFTY
ncbi:unnamed protein product, partial [Meganyctiphanes norvegica]